MKSQIGKSLDPYFVRENLSPPLLRRKSPKWGEDEETLLQWAQYLLSKSHKLDKCPAQKKKAEEVQQQFWEVYERVKKKKEDFKEKKKISGDPSCYFLDGSTGLLRKVLKRIRTASRGFKNQ